MKRLFYLSIILSICLFSCTNNEKRNQSEIPNDDEKIDIDYEYSTLDMDDEDDEDILLYDDDSEDSTKRFSAAEIDAAIDSYETLMNTLERMATKLGTGNLSMLTEVMDLLEQSGRYDEELQALQGDMTPSQLQRVLDISARFITVSAKVATASVNSAASAINTVNELEILGKTLINL